MGDRGVAGIVLSAVITSANDLAYQTFRNLLHLGRDSGRAFGFIPRQKQLRHFRVFIQLPYQVQCPGTQTPGQNKPGPGKTIDIRGFLANMGDRKIRRIRLHPPGPEIILQSERNGGNAGQRKSRPLKHGLQRMNSLPVRAEHHQVLFFHPFHHQVFKDFEIKNLFGFVKIGFPFQPPERGIADFFLGHVRDGDMLDLQIGRIDGAPDIHFSGRTCEPGQTVFKKFGPWVRLRVQMARQRKTGPVDQIPGCVFSGYRCHHQGQLPAGNIHPQLQLFQTAGFIRTVDGDIIVNV